MSVNKSAISSKQKVAAAKTYLATGQSLRKVAKAIGVSHVTLSKWVKLYKEGGEENLAQPRTIKRRISKAIESEVMYLKEQNPSLTIRRARLLLRKQGTTLSKNGIWQIWKRYGLTKRPIYAPLNPLCIATPELDTGILRAQGFVRTGNLKAAAHVLNNLPCLPRNPIVKQIPEKFLSPRRRLDRLYFEFLETPFPEFRKRIRRAGKMLERRGYIYSSITANFFELYALDWIGKPEEKVPVLDLLAKKLYRVKNSALWFTFYSEQAITYCSLLQFGKAIDTTKKCRRLMYRLPSPTYQERFGALLTHLGEYKKAHSFYKVALEHPENQNHAAQLALRTAQVVYNTAGQYQAARKMLVKAEIVKNLPAFSADYSLSKAHVSFGQGNLVQASKFFLECLTKASKEERNTLIFSTSIGLASVAMALNKKKEARLHLKKYLPLMKKYKLRIAALMLKQLSGARKIISKELLQRPPLRLINLIAHAHRTMKTADYRKAFDFARRQELLGFFHRLIVFFPAPVVHLLEKGKPTGLPPALLKFPIFNQKIIVYHIEFLGDVVVSRNQHCVRTQLSPQEKAFLIHLALRANAPGKSILLKSLYQNFWKHSKKPADRLLHLLVQLKTRIMLPGHLLNISSVRGEPRLVNRGMFITTDYGEFETFLTQVKTLERTGEWTFAKRDYSRAFALLRGAPFAKMYDNWSEEMRSAILNRLESETMSFAEGCMVHNSETEARRVLKKVLTIIPYADGIRKVVEETRK